MAIHIITSYLHISIFHARIARVNLVYFTHISKNINDLLYFKKVVDYILVYAKKCFKCEIRWSDHIKTVIWKDDIIKQFSTTLSLLKNIFIIINSVWLCWIQHEIERNLPYACLLKTGPFQSHKTRILSAFPKLVVGVHVLELVIFIVSPGII